MRSRIIDVGLALRHVSARSTWAVLTVTESDGAVGLGECTDAASARELRESLAEVHSLLHGIDPVRDRAWALEALRRRREEAAAPAVALKWSTVLGAVDAALCDLIARMRGVPAVAMLAAEAPAVVPLYANLNRGDHARRPEDFAHAARQAEQQGFQAVKLAPFDGPHPDHDPVDNGVAIVHAVRESLAPRTQLMVDVHHRLDVAELAAAVPRLEQYGLRWLEDAVDVLDAEALDWLARRTDIPLAGGELLWRTSDVVRVCRSPQLSVLLLDPKHAGGPEAMRQLLDHVSEIEVSLHNPSGPVATALGGQLAGLTACFTVLEYAFGEPVDRAAVVDPPEPISAGKLDLVAAPGIGLDLVPGQWVPG